MNPTLRLTDTNNGSDSSGRTWGLEGNLVWWLVGGLGAGIALFFMGIVGLEAGLAGSFLCALVPVVLVAAYVFLLRRGKPPGYDRDLMELLLGGRGFGPEPGSRPPFPSAEQ